MKDPGEEIKEKVDPEKIDLIADIEQKETPPNTEIGAENIPEEMIDIKEVETMEDTTAENTKIRAEGVVPTDKKGIPIEEEIKIPPEMEETIPETEGLKANTGE